MICVRLGKSNSLPVPVAWKARTIPFSDRPRYAVTIPWGDLSAAYRSTGIPNIETYMAMAPSHVSALRWVRSLLPMAGFGPFQALLSAWAKSGIAGPTAEERAGEQSLLWGRVEDGEGRAVEGTVETLEGYTLTAEDTVEDVIAERHIVNLSVVCRNQHEEAVLKGRAGIKVLKEVVTE